MKKIYLALVTLGVLLNVAVADQTPLTRQSQGEVTFVSGGVGEDERNTLQTMRADYNLSLLFTVKGTGEYLSDTKIRIEDQHGVVWLETVADGPMLFAKLKPGRYNVSATQNGYQIYQKVLIGGKKSTALSFAWPQE
jgi:hypothetical protein